MSNSDGYWNSGNWIPYDQEKDHSTLGVDVPEFKFKKLPLWSDTLLDIKCLVVFHLEDWA